MTEQRSPTQETIVRSPPGGGLAVAALVLGIGSLIPGAGLALAPIGLILGIAAARRPRRRGMAAAAIVLCAAGLTVSAVTVPPLVRAWRRQQRRVCAAHLSYLAGGIGTYRSGFAGRFPPSLGHVMETGALAGVHLRCPAAGRTGRPSDYFYHPPAADAPPGAMVACDFRGNHPGGRNVLHYDAKVRWRSESAFQAELALPHNAAFARELRKVEGATTGGRE